MKKLIQGIVDFRKNLTEDKREMFARLALGQKPDALFIACSDSRVVPNLFASTNPGDLFVIRNVGNLVPPATALHEDDSAQAAIEFSLLSLNISYIIVCGHSECGAMQAIASGIDHSCPKHLCNWLEHGKISAKKVRSGATLDKSLSEVNQISQVNVLEQLNHIKSYPIVEQKLKEGKLRLFGMWFDIGRADVYLFDEDVNKFVLIEEGFLEKIAHKL